MSNPSYPNAGKWDPDRVKLEDFYASAYVLLELAAREVKTINDNNKNSRKNILDNYR